MTQYSGMSFSLWECMSARERDEHVWLYKILNNGLGKKCSFPFGQWPTVICTGLCDFPRRMWGHPLLWSVCWMWSWPWLQMQKTFLSCTRGKGGWDMQRRVDSECVEGVWGEVSQFSPSALDQSSLSQTSALQWRTKPWERKSHTCSWNLWVFRVYFPLMIDKSGPNQIPFFRKENTKNHIFPLHFSSHIEKSHRGIDTSFG